MLNYLPNAEEKLKSFVIENAPPESLIEKLRFGTCVRIPIQVIKCQVVSYTKGKIYDYEYTFKNENGKLFTIESDFKLSARKQERISNATIQHYVSVTLQNSDTEEDVLKKFGLLSKKEKTKDYVVLDHYKILRFNDESGNEIKKNSFLDAFNIFK